MFEALRIISVIEKNQSCCWKYTSLKNHKSSKYAKNESNKVSSEVDVEVAIYKYESVV